MNSCHFGLIFVLSRRTSIEFILVCRIGLQRRARLFSHEMGGGGGDGTQERFMQGSSAHRSKPSTFTYHF